MNGTSDRPPPELFDVTIRDGSYVIDFQFRQEDVRLLYRSIDRAGFPYIEVGHGLGLNASAVRNAAAASDDEYLAAAAESCTRSRFGTFFIPGIGAKEHMRRARETFGMHFIRVGNDPEKVESLLPFLEYAKELGYEVMANFMKSYSISALELAKKAALVARHGADAVYVVDSAGGMLPDEVGDYVKAIGEHCPARIGFHGHNNLELAIANALRAWEEGASLIDCSIGGLGRSAGNTRTELFIPVLKALGLAVPYDFHGVLRVWQKIIRPLVQRRPILPVDIVGGYARIHSGQMGPFEEAAHKHRISLDTLLDAHGDLRHHGRVSAKPDALAQQLALARSAADPLLEASTSHSLLEMQAPITDEHAIRNTFKSAEEILKAAKVLAHKAYLPLVAIVGISSESSDDASVMAEYFYHDEHFIVLRISFGSVASFVQLVQQYRGMFSILVFESTSPAIKLELTTQADVWHKEEILLWANLPAIKHHYLFSILYQLATEANARSVLLVGGNRERLNCHIPPNLDHVDFFCTSLDMQALHQVGITRLQATQPPGRNRSARWAKFDLVVLLTPVNAMELQAVLGQMAPRGTLIDCLAQISAHAGTLKGVPQKILAISLRRGITGELLNLLNVEATRQQNSGVEKLSPERNPHVGGTKAA